MIVGGIDGCRGGWFLVKWDGLEYTHGLYPGLVDLFDANPGLERVFIDMPMGLGSATVRRVIEKKLRQELPGRASTVFNVPVREAVWQPDDGAAKKTNLLVEGKSLSLQTLNILPKIRELDELLRSGPYRTDFVESHPELCFKYLNGEIVVVSRKAHHEGIRQRLEILERYDDRLATVLGSAFILHSSRVISRDDVVDAGCLCLANRLSQISGISFLEQEPPVDDYGIPIRIGYCHAGAG